MVQGEQSQAAGEGEVRRRHRTRVAATEDELEATDRELKGHEFFKQHYSWIERQLPSRQKINLPTNQKGYDKSETTDEKLSARRIQIYLVYFSVIIF